VPPGAGSGADDIIKLVVRHLEQHVPPGARLTIEPGMHGARPASIARNHPVLKLAGGRARGDLRGAADRRPDGGTLPVAEMFKRILGLDPVYFSFSTGDERFHAPNEFIPGGAPARWAGRVGPAVELARQMTMQQEEARVEAQSASLKKELGRPRPRAHGRSCSIIGLTWIGAWAASLGHRRRRLCGSWPSCCLSCR